MTKFEAAFVATERFVIRALSFIRHSSLVILYIFSGTLIPRSSRPRCKTRPVNSHSASRELRDGSSDFKTGHAS